MESAPFFISEKSQFHIKITPEVIKVHSVFKGTISFFIFSQCSCKIENLGYHYHHLSSKKKNEAHTARDRPKVIYQIEGTVGEIGKWTEYLTGIVHFVWGANGIVFT